MLYFKHVYGGFKVTGKEMIYLFEIAGCDVKFHEAKAMIVGNTIEVSNEKAKIQNMLDMLGQIMI